MNVFCLQSFHTSVYAMDVSMNRALSWLFDLFLGSSFHIISTEGALRRPMTYAKHPIHPSYSFIHPIPSTLERYVFFNSIRYFAFFELNDLWSKKICRPKMIVWSPVLHSYLDDLVNYNTYLLFPLIWHSSSLSAILAFIYSTFSYRTRTIKFNIYPFPSSSSLTIPLATSPV